ncbi:hypothetical protein thsrh120_48880 [Rhizobium sp. No.120]
MAEEPIEVFKALAPANRSLAKLKGRVVAIPTPGILIDTFALQEAKASLEIENIVTTTQDGLFQADLFQEGWRLKQQRKLRYIVMLSNLALTSFGRPMA